MVVLRGGVGWLVRYQGRDPGVREGRLSTFAANLEEGEGSVVFVANPEEGEGGEEIELGDGGMQQGYGRENK